jgi:hypothetical protein
MQTKAIAVADLLRSKWIYWNAATQQFDLLEIETGKLIQLKNTPITIKLERYA